MHADHFADQLRMLAGVSDGPATQRVLNAFRSVRREDYAGPGPWKVRSAQLGLAVSPHVTPDADPKWLYHSVLVVLDEDKGINIGDPCLWVRNFTEADIPVGARVLQVGAGVGYYTAILSQIVGPEGHVTAYEVDKSLAERAKANLAGIHNAVVHHGNAAAELGETRAIDVVVAFAGVAQIPSLWLPRLSADARLLLPLTGKDWWGAMVLARRTGDMFDARTLGACGFYPCTGARSDAGAAAVSALFTDPSRLRGWHFRITGHGDGCRFEPHPEGATQRPD